MINPKYIVHRNPLHSAVETRGTHPETQPCDDDALVLQCIGALVRREIG